MSSMRETCSRATISMYQSLYWRFHPKIYAITKLCVSYITAWASQATNATYASLEICFYFLFRAIILGRGEYIIRVQLLTYYCSDIKYTCYKPCPQQLGCVYKVCRGRLGHDIKRTVSNIKSMGGSSEHPVSASLIWRWDFKTLSSKMRDQFAWWTYILTLASVSFCHTYSP